MDSEVSKRDTSDYYPRDEQRPTKDAEVSKRDTSDYYPRDEQRATMDSEVSKRGTSGDTELGTDSPVAGRAEPMLNISIHGRHVQAKQSSNKQKVLLIISDEGTGSSSYTKLLDGEKASPCLLSFSEIFVRESHWAFDGKCSGGGLWNVNDGSRKTKDYNNNGIESRLSRLFQQLWKVKVSKEEIHKGMKHAYGNIKDIMGLTAFLKDVVEYAKTVMPDDKKAQCKNRLVMSAKLFPLFIGGYLTDCGGNANSDHSSRYFSNQIEDFDLGNPNATEHWTKLMKQIGSDPEVGAIRLVRDETARELSNWRRFSPPMDKKPEPFNCDLERPATRWDKLAEKYSGAEKIDPADCWKDEKAAMACFDAGMNAAGLPRAEFVDDTFSVSSFLGSAAEGDNTAGNPTGKRGREQITVSCDKPKGGWRCFAAEDKVENCKAPKWYLAKDQRKKPRS